jgi:hypothetical protein
MRVSYLPMLIAARAGSALPNLRSKTKGVAACHDRGKAGGSQEVIARSFVFGRGGYKKGTEALFVVSATALAAC